MKHVIIRMSLFVSLHCCGAAESSQPAPQSEKPFDIARYIGVTSKSAAEPIPYRIGSCHARGKLYACIVADPNLEAYFPKDTAERLATFACQHDNFQNPNTIEDTLRKGMNSIACKDIVRAALARGITSTQFAIMFVATISDVQSCCLRGKVTPQNSDATIHVWTVKDAGGHVDFNGEFDAQDHIQILMKQKDFALVDQLRQTHLETSDFDLAIEVDHVALIEHVRAEADKAASIEYAQRERARTFKASSPTSIEGNAHLPAQRLAEHPDCATILQKSCCIV